MKSKVPFTQYAQYTPLFTVREARERYGKDMHSRSLPNLLHRLKTQGRVRFLANGVYAGALAAAPPNRYRVPRALRDDAVVALHSALELHGVANQVFRTVYYFSAGARKDVVFDHVTYHRVAFPRALAIASHRLFQTELAADNILATGRERSFVDCLLFLDYGGGVEELDKSLAMFPSFDFEAALAYLKLLHRPWLYARLGFLLDRHADKLFFRGKTRDRFLRKLPRGVVYLADKRPGNHWVPTWRLMVPETLLPSNEGSVRT
jgi:predicted transcriptional regulator of viral defense system